MFDYRYENRLFVIYTKYVRSALKKFVFTAGFVFGKIKIWLSKHFQCLLGCSHKKSTCTCQISKKNAFTKFLHRLPKCEHHENFWDVKIGCIFWEFWWHNIWHIHEFALNNFGWCILSTLEILNPFEGGTMGN